MPSIAEFLGMWITINWSDHPPPHIHIKAGEHRATVSIREARIIKGSLPLSKLKPLQKWIRLHQDALMENWQLAQEYRALKPILK